MYSCDGKDEFSLLRSSVSHDSSAIILIQPTDLIIIDVENSLR